MAETSLSWNAQTLRLTRGGGHIEGHPYLRLLRSYLDHFLPRADRLATAGGAAVGRCWVRLQQKRSATALNPSLRACDHQGSQSREKACAPLFLYI